MKGAINMYRVLLVDDEPMAMEALKIAVDWEKLGFAICGECRNGEEALDRIEEVQPDLIITDIRMPVTDGLELIRKTSRKHPFIRYVIMSGYNEFEYAREALKYNVNHYILKPVFEEELTNVLLQIREQLEQVRRIKEAEAEKSDADTGIFFDLLLYGKIHKDALMSCAPGVIPGSITVWTCAVLDNVKERRNETGFSSTKTIGMDELRTEFSVVGSPYRFVYPVGHPAGLCGFVIGSCSRAELKKTINALAEKLRVKIPFHFYLAVGNTVTNPGQLAKVLKNAEKALAFRFFRSSETILYYNQVKNYCMKHSFVDSAYLNDFTEAFESIDRKRLLLTLKNVFEDFREKLTAPEIVEIYVLNVIYRSLAIINRLGGSAEELLQGCGLSRISVADLSLDLLFEKLTDYIQGFCQYAGELYHKDQQEEKIKVRNYMLQNYKRSITISEIAGKLFFHPAYLGRQFVRWYGCSFHEYLHRLRIEEAKNLLSGTCLKTHEIAAQLGYCSYGRFLYYFKKFTSYKPNEYRAGTFPKNYNF